MSLKLLLTGLSTKGRHSIHVAGKNTDLSLFHIKPTRLLVIELDHKLAARNTFRAYHNIGFRV
jgi:hypothetical protein